MFHFGISPEVPTGFPPCLHTLPFKSSAAPCRFSSTALMDLRKFAALCSSARAGCSGRAQACAHAVRRPVRAPGKLWGCNPIAGCHRVAPCRPRRHIRTQQRAGHCRQLSRAARRKPPGSMRATNCADLCSSSPERGGVREDAGLSPRVWLHWATRGCRCAFTAAAPLRVSLNLPCDGLSLAQP